MNKSAKIYIAGHRGMVGSAIVRKLQTEGYTNLLIRTSDELDLRNQQAINNFFAIEKPAYVFLAAAKVGGIYANNTYRAEFLYDNLMIGANVIHASYLYQVKKLLFLGSSCIYPKMASQPMKESALLTGTLEPTNEPYAIAKIAGIKMCETYRTQYGCNFISAMPTNLYGPNDNYDKLNSHVLPALLQKIHDAKIHNKPFVEIWGTGRPLREFMHVDDLADACLFLMNHYDEKALINVGSGEEISIMDLAKTIQKIIDYSGVFQFDRSKPDGTPRKLMNSDALKKKGWQAKISLTQGISQTYQLFKKNH